MLNRIQPSAKLICQIEDLLPALKEQRGFVPYNETTMLPTVSSPITDFSESASSSNFSREPSRMTDDGISFDSGSESEDYLRSLSDVDSEYLNTPEPMTPVG